MAGDYLPFDLADAGLDRTQEMLVELMELFEAGVLHPLPVTAWDVRRARDAFRYMSQAKHTGKIVLTMPPRWDPEGTVLITGGTGGLGSRLARHLAVEWGMKHLLLVSRRGPDAPGAPELREELSAHGADVTIAACDVADRDALTALLAGVPAEHPLTAVVHTAAALDDGVIASLTPERLATVFGPKADAAWHLHELTRDLDLAAFMTYSSVAGQLGGAGLGSYAAANAFLDALANHRRAEGLPGQSLLWGPWAQDGGMTSELTDTDIHRLNAAGMPLLTEEQGVALFDAAATCDEPVVAPVRLNLAALRAQGEVPGLLRGLVRTARRTAGGASASESGAATALTQRLAGLREADRLRLLIDLVRGQAAAVLGHPSPDAVEVRREFRDLGFDSLTAVELRNRLGGATGLRLPATLVFDYPTPTALAEFLLRELLGDHGEVILPTAVTSGLADDPIVIVGMSCRYPGGVRSPEDLWQLVAEGRDAIAELPTDRGWRLDAGAGYEGGFLYDAAEFDAGFFGISPREALAMDPQQRLLLETAWEVFERTGIDPASVRGTDAGVFVGATGFGYLPPQESRGHHMTGQATSVISGRLSYTFGLEGPAVTVDTACSSSLVAMHLAAQALRTGECSLALAGGVTVMSTPIGFGEFSEQGGMAPDGRCHSFADSAAGTSWSEGVGLVVLERLSDAVRNGHEVLAVVRGSAVNQDGASNGLTAPNGPSQQRVIRQALANAGLAPVDVDAVEAHGTGTTLGDPIEAQALLATYGQDRELPLRLGSIKSNMGHTQVAAGMAGVIKMVMALRNGVLPKTLHVDTPSTHVDWTAGAVELLTEPVEWPETGRPRRAGVSAFGVSGTNVHTILEQAPPPAELKPDDQEIPAVTPAALPWVVSAKTAEALHGQAVSLLSHVEGHPGAMPVDIGHSLVSTRSVLEHRAVVVGGDREELLSGLTALGADGPAAGVVRGVADVEGRSVFVFPGQGSQWAGMGARLMDDSPVFAERLAECAAALAPFIDWSLMDVVRQVDGAPSLERVDVVQPVSWAVMVSLAALWRSSGVEPDAVVGHSQGEIAAACVAGALSLEDGARVVALRSQAIARRLAGAGGMASVPLPVAEVEARLERWAGRVSIAAVNGPRSVVVSGDSEALDQLVEELTGEEVRIRRIAVDYASHSAHVEGIHEELLAELAPVAPCTAEVPFFSTVTGDWLDTTGMDADYWYRNLRQTVGFEPAIRALLTQEHRAFIEVSSHPVLTMAVQETIDATGDHAVTAGTLRRDEGGLGRFLTSLAEVFVRGVDVAWAGMFADTGAHRVDLPTYAFQRERYWPDETRPGAQAAEADTADAEFWSAVEQEDLESLADWLEIDGGSLGAVLPALSAWRGRRREQSTVDSWRYRTEWRPLRMSSVPVLTGTWLVVTADGIADGEVTAALAGHGAQVRRLELDESCVDRAELASRLQGVDGIEDIRGMVSVLAFAEQPSAGYPVLPSGLALSLALVQALDDIGADAPLWCLTRGAVSTGRADRLTSPVQAQVLGLGRTAALEHPRRWGGLVDLPAELDQRAAQRLAGALAGTEGEDGEGEFAIRPSGVFVRRVVRTPADDSAPKGRWQPRGTTLITGGTGVLGQYLARWLAHNGAEDLVLTSRRGMAADGAAELVAELAELGTTVEVVACDVADRDAVAAMISRLTDEGRVIRTAVHVAAYIDLVSLSATDHETFAAIVDAKVAGARHLHELLDDEQLDAVVYYSSIAGIWGSGDHGAYGAANSYLEALAEHRRAHGLRATSIAWGIWRDDQVRVDPRQILGSGLRYMQPELAHTGLRRALDDDETLLTIADIDWDRYYPVYTSVRPSPLFSEVPEVRGILQRAEDTVATSADGEFAARIRGLSAAEGERALLDLVRAEAAAVLGHGSPDAISERRAFRDVGFDSLTAVDLRNRVARATGLTLPSTLVFDYPSPVALVEFLRSRIVGSAVARPGTPAPTVSTASDEPIAIIGMACRFPGGIGSPEQLWEVVAGGQDIISEFPADRGWDAERLYDPDPDKPGKTYSTRGGFLHDAAEFDAGFFGISPREALAMDPQQRLLLETSWEAFERAGIDPASVRGSLTGTFIGSSYQDYGFGPHTGSEGAEGYMLTSSVPSVLSGRISYLFGLEGPAVTLDTACSSSLVALHLACQSLRNGESTLALAGGVTVMTTPGSFLAFSRQRGMAADGRCKAFAESADGMSLSEGVGLLLVERLSDARRNGHPVLAVVRGSAINQDGASNGLTAPNGPSQQRVIGQALTNAKMTANDIDAVEAHGTGTTLGDPIEAQALLATYGQERERPLLLGSVKSNLGHTQLAAGAASVIKMVMAMRYGVLPKTLHIDEPTSHVDWSSGAVELLTEQAAWPETGHPRRVGISAFGISGTNAHAILEQGPRPEADDGPVASPVPARAPGVLPVVLPVVVSGKSEEALRAQAARVVARVEEEPSGLGLVDLAYSLATTRSGFERRGVVLAGARPEAVEGLRAVACGESGVNLVQGVAREDRVVAFLFSGQGSQRAGMGRELYEACPVFAEALDEVCAHLDAHLDRPLREVLFAEAGSAEAELLDETAWTQPGLFAVEVALFRLVESWGVRPDYVAGHSVGEIAAAHVAGVFSLADACTLVAARARLMGELPSGGAMVSLQATEDEVTPYLGERVSIAAVNGPRSVVISGEEAPVLDIATRFAEEGRKTRRLRVSHAFHSVLMDGMVAEFGRVARGLSYGAPAMPLVSGLTGEPVTAELVCAPEYWVRQVREAVRFADGVRWLDGRGVSAYLEIGPDGVLSAMAQESLPEQSPTATVVASALRKGAEEERAVVTALARLYAHGVEVDWSAFFAGTGARRIDLPTYAFQHQRYWPEVLAPAPAADADLTDADADTDFWAVVEGEDLESLASRLEVDGDSLGAVLPALTTWRRRRREQSVVDGWRYRAGWTPLADPTPQAQRGSWLVVVPADQQDDAWVTSVADATPTPALRVEITEPDRAALADRLREVAAESGPFAGVLSLLGAYEHAVDGHPGVPAGVALTTTLVQALGDAGIESPLWAATRGAVSVSRSDTAPSPAQAAVWGLGRVAALEYPGRWGGLIDLPGTLDRPAGRRLAAVLSGAGDEDQIAVRSSGLFGRRVVPCPAELDVDETGFTATGTVLITGGTGGLGGHVARWLARCGAEHLVLTSRRGPDAPGARELCDELTELGARVTLAACDVSDREALAAVLGGIADDSPLTGVVHTAGIAQAAAPLDGASDAETAEVMTAKVVGAANLDSLLGDRDLDFFVLFSSVAATWGSGGQGAYGAANAYLDALADARTARGLTATSVAWGAWADGGMAAADGAQDYLARRGLILMAPETAIAGLSSALRNRDVTVAVADVDWDQFAPAFTLARPSALLRDLPAVRRALTADITTRYDDESLTSLRGRLRAMADDDERLDALLGVVREQVALVLGHSGGDAIEADRAFKDLGFDSLTAVELRNRLATATGLPLPTTLVFDYPSPAALVDHLRAELLGERTDPGGAALPAASVVTRPSRVSILADDPIAIVGMSCRYPGGVRSPEDLWRLVTEGRDAISPFPADRGWNLDADTAFEGGFVHDATEFDARFFGISPREALAMDPQQRLLLESAWEVFERAGIDPAGLRGSDAGVFIGATGGGYVAPEESLGHMMTGQATSVVSGRLSYTFGLEGPAVTVDTACSSSLVAMHMAMQALRGGECSLALAGGVTVMSSPAGFAEFRQQGGLAQDGRCKSFAEGADGTGWSEGVGLVVLERLSDARRHGHEVLAVVRGSAVNQDGASNGLTAPNGPSQQRVIRQALANAGLAPADVDAVEAHGTGTTLGDPIEAQALLATYGRDRELPLRLGSIKSNIGHTQSASGVAGVIKMVMAMRHGTLPKTLHVDAPSTHVDWASGAVELLTEAVEWPEHGRPRRAGVSSFGMSGTNAHAILEQAPEDAVAAESAEDDTPALDAVAVPWVVSARTAEALRGQAISLLSHAESHPEATPTDIGHSLLSSRSVLEHRAVVVGGDREELLSGLRALGDDDPAAGVVRGVADVEGKSVFVFPGQGSQWAGMGVRLLDESPVFAERLAECAVALTPFIDWSLMDVLRQVEGAPSLERVDVVQPVSWAVMVSLAAMWRSHGVEPDAVVGHSQGEIAAACVAGALSLDDGARVVALRSQAIARRLAGAGGMASVPLPVAEVEAWLERWDGRVSIAAVNGPRSVVVSGDQQALDELIEELTGEEVRIRRIAVDYASHSAHVEEVHEALLAELAPVAPRTAEVPFLSTVTGEWLEGGELDADYWYRNLRQTVGFEPAVRELLARRHRAFIEISAHPVLTVAVQETVDDIDETAVVAGTLRRDQGGLDRFALSLAELFVRGVHTGWAGFFTATGARRIDLPTYAFQRQRFWPEAAETEPLPGDKEAVDAEFWAAVEQEELESLAARLEVDTDSLGAVLPALSSWRQQRRERSTVDGWRYRTIWKPVTAEAAAPSGTWLVVVPQGLADDPWVSALADAVGADAVRLEVGDAGRAALADRLSSYVTDRVGGADGADGAEFAGVLSLLALSESALPEYPSVPAGVVLTATLMQALGDAGIEAPVWAVTRGAVSLGHSDRATAPLQNAVWGLGRVAALEYPRSWGGLIDLPADLDDRIIGRFVGTLAARTGEDQVAIRSTGVFGRRMVQAPAEAPDQPWQPSGTVLITGGTGALGGHVARWLAGNGAEHLLLTSRRGPDAPGADELRAELSALGAQVTIAACDVADRDALAALLATVPAEHPLTGVVHTAGVLDDGLMDGLTPERYEPVFRSKVASALLLDELTRDLDLAVFALFASSSGALGSRGQANYAAANAVLDALAERRRADGLAATSVAWGLWAGAGMAADTPVEAVSQRAGVLAMDPKLAVMALAQLVTGAEPTAFVSALVWDRFAPTFSAVRPSPLLSEIPEARRAMRAVSDEPADGSGESLRERLARMPEPERVSAVVGLVRKTAAAVLGYDSADAVESGVPFRDLGFDSLTAVEFSNRLAAATQLRLKRALVFDYPSPTALSQHLLEQLLPGGTGGTGGADDAATVGGAGGHGRVLAEIDRLEATLATATTHRETRLQVRERLSKLLAQWGDEDLDGGPGGVDEQLLEASDEEVFDFIGKEFGIS
ncbi:modular polyketide synthase [Streptomyces bingchenggensis BCW-1]|uniref:Modular polyketide synthase n=1 Tax=Streptomyces bingchenggensis (strain BCW-1) TaxID=749414 RepID=D7BRE1_STRBB|nr:type I polyketide synthase [Streptomyces bingchenggensis]ADI05104.1 modular polyketide synthase [Streptomyces bingchenggensis BCW-1]